MSDQEKSYDLTGGCICGAVKYEIKGKINRVSHCHCRMCQKSSGAPFMTWIDMPRDSFKITEGELVFYRSSADAKRGSCGHCGSKITWEGDKLPDRLDVSIMTLSEPESVTPDEHIYYDSRAMWLNPDPHLPKRSSSNEPQTGGEIGENDTVEGGCLCGQVRFRATGTPDASSVCHCDICQFMTGAAVTGWAVYPADRFEHIQGETKSYQSSAKGRRHFCTNCHSYLYYESIPHPEVREFLLGALDDPNQIVPPMHTWMVDSPTWLDIVDARPRFPRTSDGGGEFHYADT